LFAVYLGSGLGLLMLTSLLGLERYVNKRGAELPGIVSRTWMVVGTLFALAVMLVMLILPSPSISNGLENALAFLTTNTKEPNKHALGKDGQKQGENPNNEKVDNQAKDALKRDGDKGEVKGKGKDGKQSSKNKSQSDNKSDSKSGGKGKSQGKDQKSDPKSGDKSSPKSKSQTKDKGQRPQGDKDAQDQKSKTKSKDSGKKQGDKGQDEPNDKVKRPPKDQQAKNPPQKQEQKQAQKQGNNNGRAKPGPAPNPASKIATSISKSLGSVIKLLVYTVGIIALLITLWLFRDELTKLWNDLFGANPESETTETADHKKQLEKPQPSFESFREPFSSGQASKWTSAQTIQYTFQALEAWGRGYQQPRDNDQTPHEFAKQLVTVDKEVAGEARRLADLHGQSLFSENDVDQKDASQLRKIWKLMSSKSPGRLSAAATPALPQRAQATERWAKASADSQQTHRANQK